MDVFDECAEIADLLSNGIEIEARNRLITLLDYHDKGAFEYSPLLNCLIRQLGLYPYLNLQTASWQERFVYEAFKVDAGESQARTLHREQSAVLKMLLEGRSIAVSAPTSFGKTFIIDAYISIKRPSNVLIIVPTIALMDEVRRRLVRKFGRSYKIITTTGVDLAEKNLLIFPQERAAAYLDQLKSIDLFVVDEFYKAGSAFDRERSPALVKAILKLQSISKQRYFLAPNIDGIRDNFFTQGMEFVNKLHFNTVYLEQNELYRIIEGDELLKGAVLLELIESGSRKTLVYAATYNEIGKLVSLITAEMRPIGRQILKEFSDWLSDAYGPHWTLTKLVLRGVGIHNGQLHRSLSQIQLRLFELKDGLNTIISTSSMIEGVNTTAEAVVLWKNRRGGQGNRPLDTFTYKNIIGRSGRMFKYFVGKVYLLEEPPDDSSVQLEIELPDSVLGGIDEDEHKDSLTDEQVSKIISFKERMTELLGKDEFKRLFSGAGLLQVTDSNLILTIAESMARKPQEWNGLAYLNSENPSQWRRWLFEVLRIQPAVWDIEFRRFVRFVMVLSRNWILSIPQLLVALEDIDIDLDLFFRLERNVTFKLAVLFHDINELQKSILDNGVDISPFVSKLSHAFLPTAVFQLEEFGLPRMISRKIHAANLIDLTVESPDIHSVIGAFLALGQEKIYSIESLTTFDRFIISYFFEGIESLDSTI